MPLELHEQILYLAYEHRNDNNSVNIFVSFPDIRKTKLLNIAKELKAKNFVTLHYSSHLDRANLKSSLDRGLGKKEDFLNVRITITGIDYVKEKILPKIKAMTFLMGYFFQRQIKEKKRKLLQELYIRNNGQNHNVQEILDIDFHKAYQIAKSLDEEGKIKMAASKDSVYAKILGPGIEAIEESEEPNPANPITIQSEFVNINSSTGDQYSKSTTPDTITPKERNSFSKVFIQIIVGVAIIVLATLILVYIFDIKS